MSDPAIQVEKLSKRYTIYHKKDGSGLRHVINDVLTAPFRLAKSVFSKNSNLESSSQATEDFWALKEVSFDIQPGDVVGVVGRNGAGKSTLLKILSRITEPTNGRITMNGRVASLLEVGTGFHPELSGRENIFLNGAILGMSRAEIRRKFDDIVAFSEIEKFIDTPVKRYSSGMYVRLAFAVAAHLEPEILIVDEVLAVGDAQFQRKCLGKMNEVSKGGRTILFVSHSMSAIAQLCKTGLFFQRGQLVHQGPISEIVTRYLTSDSSSGENRGLAVNVEELRKRKKLFFHSAGIRTAAGTGSVDLDVREPFDIELTYEVPSNLTRVELSIRIMNTDGRPVFTTLQSECSPDAVQEVKQGLYSTAVTVPGMLLMPGNYVVNIAAHEPIGEIFDVHESVVGFTVHDTGTVFAIYNSYGSIGTVMQTLPWRQRQLLELPGTAPVPATNPPGRTA